MKQLVTTILVLLLGIISMHAQTGSLKGKVEKGSTGKPIKGATIEVFGTSRYTNSQKDGSFLINNIIPGEYNVIIKFEGYQLQEKTVNIIGNETIDLGAIAMNPASDDDASKDPLMEAEVAHEPIVTISSSELAGDEESSNISGLLHGSKDVFVSTAGYTFGPMRFRIRGYDSKYTTIYMNGVPMNNMETGRTYWANWGGLNDVTRNKETFIGLKANNVGFADIGGYTNIDTRASNQRKNTQVTYSRSNRSYRNRVMLTGSYDLGNSTWLSASGSRRWSEEGYVEGTFYDAAAYFLALEKKLNEKHSLLLTGYGSYSRRGKQGGSTQQVYDALDNNFYNPYWGYQDGEKRNSRVGTYHKPTIILNHNWDIDKSTWLKTSVAYRFGRGGSTALSWYDARDPRPDDYKNFDYTGEYLSPEAAAIQRFAFENDPSFNQLNWQYFYTTNHYNVETVDNVDGIEGNSITGKRSQYYIEDRRTDQQYLVANTNFHKAINPNITFTGGLEYKRFISSTYKLMDDLLGGDFILDVDKYAVRDFGNQSEQIQSDLQHPNKIIKEGDKFGYDYDANIWNASAWLQTELSFNKVDMFVAGQAVNTEMWRTGYMQNGKFPDESLGDSEKVTSFDLGAKGGVTYKLSGRNYLTANVGSFSNAPTFELAFLSPRTRDHINEDAVSETIVTADFGYTLRAPKVKASLNFYYTQFQDQSDVFYFYNDALKSFGAYFLSNIDKVHRGLEFGLESKLTSSLTATGVAALGYYYYNDRPKGAMVVDKNAEVMFQDRTIYVQNFKEPGTPQTAGSIGLKYNSPKYWFIGTNANYVDDIYLSFMPERRTSEGLGLINPDHPDWDEAIMQEQLADAFTMDMFAGKSFKWDNYYFLMTLNVSNLLDNTKFITGGYENSRIDPDGNIGKFPSKYYYYYGRTFFLNVRFSF